ncbi:MAG: flagellar biosynthetic protein FliR [Phycisphaerae bacterium]|nr:flagellar biosynthetic protein FliR [Phycisphaerae bacterium]
MLQHVVPYLLVAFRLGGLFIMGPLVAGVAIPGKVKGLLVLMIAAAAYPMTPARVVAPESLDLFALLPLVFSEALVGLVIGGVAALPMLAMDMAGVVTGQQMGFGLAKVYNPEIDADADVIGQLLFYLAMSVFLSLGGLEAVFGQVLRSFDTIPPGAAAMDGPTLALFVDTIGAGFSMAMRVSAPALGTVFLVTVLFGVLTKTIPQINTMTIGFTVKILAALLLLAASLHGISTVVGDHISDAASNLTAWVERGDARGGR